MISMERHLRVTIDRTEQTVSIARARTLVNKPQTNCSDSEKNPIKQDVVREFLSSVGRRLEASGQGEFAGFGQAVDPTLHSAYRRLEESALGRDALSCLVFGSFWESAAAWEAEFRSLMRQVGRANLNRIRSEALTAGVAAEALLMLDTIGGFSGGALGTQAEEDWKAVSTEAEARTEELAHAESLGLSALDGLLSLPLQRRLIRALHVASQWPALYGTLLTLLTERVQSLSWQHAGARDEGSPSLSELERRLEVRRRSAELLVELQLQPVAVTAARTELARGAWRAGLSALAAVMFRQREMLSWLVEMERRLGDTSSVEAQGNLELTNFAYVDRLGAQLLRFGEPETEVAALRTGLFEYAQKSKVTCAEMIEDEILRLRPKINAENLARARLEVRLSDPEHLLSVARRDWMVGVFEGSASGFDNR